MLSVIMLSAIMQYVIMLSAIMQSAIMLSVVAPWLILGFVDYCNFENVCLISRFQPHFQITLGKIKLASNLESNGVINYTMFSDKSTSGFSQQFIFFVYNKWSQ